MKKFLSLIMVAAMLVAVFAMVGCNNNTGDTTTTAAPVETTTKAPDTTTTAAPETTTEAPAPETTTKAPETTTEAPVPETTTKAPETTTKAPETTTTTKQEEAAITTGTTLGIFDRFDWGTDSKAQAEGETSHEYLVANLTIDASRIAVEYTEDTIIIHALKDYDSGAGRDAYALQYLDIVTFDFDDEFIPGWGTWAGAPMNPNTNSWVGLYQYAKVRILNNTTNNVISMHWHRAGEGFSTRTVSSSMYLQGGAPTTTSNNNLTTTPTTEWAVYYYDMMFLASIGRALTDNMQNKSYLELVNQAKAQNGYYGHNWNTANGNITAINFHFLGQYSYSAKHDTRANIKRGTSVEVDYVVFGSSIEQLAGYTSYMEDAAK